MFGGNAARDKIGKQKRHLSVFTDHLVNRFEVKHRSFNRT